MRNQISRIEALEARNMTQSLGKPFLWPAGQSLADALAHAHLTLDDEPLFGIQLVGLDGMVCRHHEADGYLVA